MKNKQYIKLPQISNQKIRQKYYTAESISHPAKAQISMMHWILKKFCQDGDVVLDPMAGIFTTGVEGMRLFPNSLFIGVELEDKFVKMTQANIKKVERIAKKDMFLKIGKAICVQGDARELSKIMKKKVNEIITSPPYSERYAYKDPEKEQKNDPYASKRDRIHKPYSQNPNNIGNLNYGTADKIITSPPFQEADIKRSGSQKSRANYNYGSKLKHTSKNPNNIANLAERKYGLANKIITSPPYSKDVEPHTEMRPEARRENTRGYVDEVITSPPYEEGIGHGRGKNEELIRSKKIYLKGRDAYSESKTNIGSLTGKTYLGEMLRVYSECFKILKTGGLMILIVKDFIRQKKRVHLGEDTIKLCQAAGFAFKEIYYRKIEHPSFWRVLYQQKYPEVEKIDSEDILVFQK